MSKSACLESFSLVERSWLEDILQRRRIGFSFVNILGGLILVGLGFLVKEEISVLEVIHYLVLGPLAILSLVLVFYPKPKYTGSVRTVSGELRIETRRSQKQTMVLYFIGDTRIDAPEHWINQLYGKENATVTGITMKTSYFSLEDLLILCSTENGPSILKDVDAGIRSSVVTSGEVKSMIAGFVVVVFTYFYNAISPTVPYYLWIMTAGFGTLILPLARAILENSQQKMRIQQTYHS